MRVNVNYRTSTGDEYEFQTDGLVKIRSANFHEWEYVPDEPVSAEICGKVSLSGKKISEESFEFILVKDNTILEQVKCREDG
jgi:hypothetical protein